MNFNDLAREVHQNAVAHGWWDKERTVGEILSLCHSELSEALEEYRAGRPMVYRICRASDGCPCDREKCGDWDENCGACEIWAMDEKPEGIAVELGDCIIRILDYLGKTEANVDALMNEAGLTIPKAVKPVFGDNIAEWHSMLSAAYNETDSQGSADFFLAACIKEILDWAEANGVDMEPVLREKHAYNRTRPYRHGGKVL